VVEKLVEHERIGVNSMTNEDVVSEEKRFVEDMRAGNDEAWSRLFDEETPRILALALRYGLSKEDAQEVCLETFVRLFRSVKFLQVGTKLRPYLYRIARNVMSEMLRPGKYPARSLPSAEGLAEEGNLMDVVLYATPASGDAAVKKELVKRVREVIEELPKRQRDVLVLFYLDDLNVNEIAEKTGISSGSVRVYLSKARQRLNTKLAGVVGE
jgi:RNA polymerase sigma-70 factor (ECF subfamily)